MLTVFKKLGWFFRQERKRYAVAVPLLIFAGFLEIIPPKLVGDAIDSLQQGSLTWTALSEIILVFIVVVAANYSITYIWMRQLFGGAFIVERKLRTRLMRHFLRMAPLFYEKHRTGDLMARSTKDLLDVSTTAGYGIMVLVDSTTWTLTLLVVMAALVSWKLTLAAILPLPLLALAIQVYGNWIHERFKKAQDAFGDMNNSVLETIAGVRMIRAFVQEKEADSRFRAVTKDVLEKNIAVARIDSLFEPTVKLTVGASYLIGIGYGAYLVFQGELTVGALVTFNVYLGMMIWPMFAIGELMNIIQRGNASLDRIDEVLSYPPDVADHPAPTKLSEAGAIEFRDVTFRFPSSAAANLDRVNVRIERGETIGIVGRIGSGKTTFLKQLLREYPGGEGTVLISGIPIEEISLDVLRSCIGYVPQNPFLFSRTVRDNIVFGRDEANKDRLEEVVRISALEKDLEFFPQGIDTVVGEKGVTLSGGQKQRISIARALYHDPQILLLDDALSAVDAKTETELVERLRLDRQGKTTLIVSHRISAVQHADRILVFDDGRIAEVGTHEQLLASGGWYKKQFERQQAEADLTGKKGEQTDAIRRFQ